MGLRLQWVAVAGATADEACDLLSFSRSGQVPWSAMNAMQELPLGVVLPQHYLILEDAREEPPAFREPALALASRRFELVTGLVIDAASTTDAALWRDGNPVWQITYEGHDEGAKFVIKGSPPVALADWQRKAEDGSEVPLRATLALTGFDPEKLREFGLERLQSKPVEAKPVGRPGWLGRLFGPG